ncbi:hypothetical protein V8G54_010100 [Vigna mungo]|uniref:Uncharacterized protein n=1 Tax=Vigna mungo TaxID=3915 RepID=A0AAQ3S5G9_VIGMU
MCFGTISLASASTSSLICVLLSASMAYASLFCTVSVESLPKSAFFNTLSKYSFTDSSPCSSTWLGTVNPSEPFGLKFSISFNDVAHAKVISRSVKEMKIGEGEIVDRVMLMKKCCN